MCVICYIPKESKGLSYRDIKDMWDTNPHGAGMMWLEKNGKVAFKKGYFNIDELYRDYLIIKNDYNFECALHFRIATGGGINEKMCHPFVMTNKDKYLIKTIGYADVCVMHNGIINIPHRKNFSDTAEYVKHNLYPMYKKDKRFFLHFTKNQKALVENEIGFGSKLLIFSNEGIEMVGYWSKYKDCYCSNLNFTWRSENNWGMDKNTWKDYKSFFKYDY